MTRTTKVGSNQSVVTMRAIPKLLVLCLGQSFMIKGSIGLVGQEAPPKERGAIFATNSMFGAAGILILSFIGGRLFVEVNAR